MSRIAVVEELSADVREILATRISRDGAVKSVYRVIANQSDVLRAFCVFGDMFNRGGQLPGRSREIAILRTAWRTGAEYEAGYHLGRARDLGIPDPDIARLRMPGTEGLQPADALVVGVADELCERDEVSSGMLAAMQAAGWAPGLIVELILLVGFYRMIAGLVNSADLPVEE